jgi:hypothetical protein
VIVQQGLVRVARGCWIPEQFGDDLLARCIAALETSADDTVVAGTTAARVHRLWLPQLPDEIHLATVEPGRASNAMTRTRRPELKPHRRQLTDEDVTAVGGVRVFSVARTWVDLAAVLSLPDLVAAGDSALRGLCTTEQLDDMIRRNFGRRGVRRARAALPLLNARSRSRPESHLRLAASAPCLPQFAVNEAIYRDQGGWLAEPDLSLAEAKLALEYQGEEHGTIERMRRDITRDADMRSEGWRALLYGPAQVFGRPWLIAPEVIQIVRERAPHLLRRSRSRVVT